MTGEPSVLESTHRLHGIEALRCVAATMIVVYHTVEIPGIGVPSGLNVIRTHFGMGVPLFYTLSGFVLAYGYLDSLGTPLQVRRFYVRRFFRIAPLFYVMLGVWIFYSRVTSPDFAVGPFEFFLNLSLLFGLVPGRHESLVAAGWSIGVESLFYLVFPVVAAVLTTRLAAAAAFAVFVVISSMTFHALVSLNAGSFAYMNLVTHLPFFLSGVWAYLVWRYDGFQRRQYLGTALLIGVIGASLAIVYVPPVFMFLMSFTVLAVDRCAWALVFAALILSVCYAPTRVVVNPVTRYLGKISFSMYLLHPFFIGLFIRVHPAIEVALGGGVPALAARVAFVLGVVAAVSSATYAFIEKPAMDLGKRLTSRT